MKNMGPKEGIAFPILAYFYQRSRNAGTLLIIFLLVPIHFF